MGWDPWLDATALEQARAIRERRLSSEELVRAYLARIEAWNPQLCAFVDLAPLRALTSARERDAQLRRHGAPLGPFHGVPIGIKDLNFVRGFYTRMGSRSVPYVRSPLDDFTTRALRRAGFVVLGKLATSELGAMPVTEPDIHPPTRNPWNLEHTAGGSSGGSAAAVAARLLPIAHGSDGGGSIRIPSSFCHLFGFKPSRGLVRNPFGVRDPRMLYTCGPIARSVEDAAAMLDVLTVGSGELLPASSFAELAELEPRPLQIKLTLRPLHGRVDPEVAAATLSVARALEQLGHHVEEAEALDIVLEDVLPLWAALIGSVPIWRGRVQPITRWLMDEARSLHALERRARHDRLAGMIMAWFGGADLWLSPSVPILPPRVGAFANLPAAEAFRAAAVLGAYTAIYNITGQPAAALPAGFSASGLPIGVQLVGRRRADGTVLALAKQLQTALPFRQHQPAFACAQRRAV
jgi:amidase